MGLDLSPEQRRDLSREEVASILDAGIRFEATLEAGVRDADRSNHVDDRSTPRHDPCSTPHRGRIPKGWTDLCAVDANGAPTTER